MEEPNEQWLFEQVDTNIRLSHKLLHAFNEKHHSLESQFLCLSCNGISINPLFCKKCKYTYCQLCLLALPESNVRCLCKNRSKANFESQLDHELLKTKYCVMRQSGLKKDVQITYLMAISCTNGNPYNFLSIYLYDIICSNKKNYFMSYQEINKHLTKHKQKFDCQFALKNARLINFHFAHGYSLMVNEKILCKYDAIFLSVLYLREIKFETCLFNLDFSLSFCKSIRFNIKRIETFHISSYYSKNYNFKNNFKSCFTILNAIQFCTKMKSLKFESKFYVYKLNISFPKSFNNFLSNFYVLKTIFFEKLIFDDAMNLNSFKSLISLQTLRLENCFFQNKIVFYFLLDNIPNLNELILSGNKIKYNSLDINIIEENIKFKETIKFSPILRIEIFDDYFIENAIFQDLIQFDKIKMKYIQLSICGYIYPRIPNFVNFLKCTSLQYLEIDYLKEIEGCNLKDFCNYLKNTRFLMGLKLTDMMIDNLKFDLLVQAISVNKSIKVLSFANENLSNFAFYLNKLILTNQYITTLILYECKFSIDLNFIEALSKNKTLLYLNLVKNKINNEQALKLSSLNLKGINVGGKELSEESKKLIFQKIPRKEFPLDLLSYENF